MEEADSRNQKQRDIEEVKSKIQDAQAAAREVAKDAVLLSQHSRVLKAKSEQARTTAQELRAQAKSLTTQSEPGKALFTVAEACVQIGVCERTLRLALLEPEIKLRLIEKNRRSGTFYKFVTMLPQDLVTELMLRFVKHKQRRHSSSDNSSIKD